MSDHIPDVTKMISDTPRTDQQNDDLLNSDSYTSWLEMSGFARKLERELNAANERIKRLEEVGDAMEIYCDTRLARKWLEAKEDKP